MRYKAQKGQFFFQSNHFSLLRQIFDTFFYHHRSNDVWSYDQLLFRIRSWNSRISPKSCDIVISMKTKNFSKKYVIWCIHVFCVGWSAYDHLTVYAHSILSGYKYTVFFGSVMLNFENRIFCNYFWAVIGIQSYFNEFSFVCWLTAWCIQNVCWFLFSRTTLMLIRNFCFVSVLRYTFISMHSLISMGFSEPIFSNKNRFWNDFMMKNY